MLKADNKPCVTGASFTMSRKRSKTLFKELRELNVALGIFFPKYRFHIFFH